MKILLTHRYFWPDSSPYGAMLRTIGEGLAEAGHDVRVFTTKPSYREGVSAPGRERLAGMGIRRIGVLPEHKGRPLTRALNVLLFCVPLFFQVLRQRPDVVTSATFPPIFEGLVTALAARLVGARMIYHLQDIHPELSEHAGGFMGRKPLAGIFRWLDTLTLKRASAVVALSGDMADTLRARPGQSALNVNVINNFALDAFDTSATIAPELAKPEGVTRIIFAGNLGRFQNVPLLADGVGLLLERHRNVELLLLGDGVVLPELKARWGAHPQVRFHPFIPFADAQEVIRQADIGLVSLAPGVFRVSYPSKVLTYLALGLPMLALVEPQSQLAADITRNGLGVVPSEATPEAIATALERLLADRQALATARAKVVAYHEAETSIPAAKAKWCALVDSLSSPARAGLSGQNALDPAPRSAKSPRLQQH